MERKLQLCFGYTIEGHVAAGNIDTHFYSHLPDVEIDVVDRDTGKPIADIPPIEQTVAVTGRTVVSSAALAAIIKDYLSSRERKIKISIVGTNKQIKYEGPNLKTDASEIKAMIETLASDGDNLQITSFRLTQPE